MSSIFQENYVENYKERLTLWYWPNAKVYSGDEWTEWRKSSTKPEGFTLEEILVGRHVYLKYLRKSKVKIHIELENEQVWGQARLDLFKTLEEIEQVEQIIKEIPVVFFKYFKMD